jgi:two-component system, NarL family, nitrate/nitrite response regulator NarL
VLYSGGVPSLRLVIVGEDALARAGLRALAEAAGLQVVADAPPADLEDVAADEADAVAWDVGPRGAFEALRAVASRLPLTPREMEVLQLVAEGLTNRRIAGRLGISEHTAKFHVNAILGKLGASSRSEAVAQAARLGLVLL